MNRYIAGLVALTASVVIPMPQASAADWAPPGPIKMMIAFAAGGGADTQARIIAEELEKRHGWKIIPEQVPGKGGTILAAKLKSQPKDGSVIAMSSTDAYGYSMVAAKKAGYTAADVTPIATTASFEMAVVSLSKGAYKTYADVLTAAKAGKPIRVGTMSPKLADLSYLLSRAGGVKFNIVSLNGGKAVMDALNAGDIDIGWGAGIQTAAVRAGDMLQIASGMSKKLALSPDAPTMAQLGVKFHTDGYFVFVAPPGLPTAVRETFAKAIKAIAEDKSSKSHALLVRGFGGPDVLTGTKLDQFFAQEAVNARELLQAVSAK